MVKFEVGKSYGDSKLVCVWRTNGKRSKGHFVEQWEHEMNLVLGEDDYASERRYIGSGVDNGVFPIHVIDGVERAQWCDDHYELSASDCRGSVKMKASKREREAMAERARLKASGDECRRFYASVFRGAVKYSYLAIRHGVRFARKVVGSLAFIFSSKSTPKYSARSKADGHRSRAGSPAPVAVDAVRARQGV